MVFFAPGMALAQAIKPGDLNIDKSPEFNDAQREFSNLPEQKRIDYINHMNEAQRLCSQKRIFEALEQLDQARKIFDRNSNVFNMIGACYLEFRNFPKAREFYQKALALSPGDLAISFNIAELEFVTRNWQACLDKMSQLLPFLPEQGLQTRRLIELKILLCHISLGNAEEVKTRANRYDPLTDDSPYYYYAQASLHYMKNEVVKAEEYLQMANRVFANPAYISDWQDTLIEYGFIKSFYGGEQGAAKE